MIVRTRRGHCAGKTMGTIFLTLLNLSSAKEQEEKYGPALIEVKLQAF